MTDTIISQLGKVTVVCTSELENGQVPYEQAFDCTRVWYLVSLSRKNEFQVDDRRYLVDVVKRTLSEARIYNEIMRSSFVISCVTRQEKSALKSLVDQVEEIVAKKSLLE